MSLQTRLEALASAIGADIKNLYSQVSSSAGTTLFIDGGATPSEANDGIPLSGAGALLPTIADAKGDLLVATSADIFTNLPAGLPNEVLTVDPASSVGIKWSPVQAAPVSVYEMTADQTFSTVTLADITDWVVPLPANMVTSLDAIMVFSSAALTTGFQFAATPRNVGNTAAITPTRFLVTFEYQTSATAWATFTQTVPTTPMAVTTAAYVANSGILCRVTGQIEMGATAGELHMQARSEVAGSAITIRRGNPLRVM